MPEPMIRIGDHVWTGDEARVFAAELDACGMLVLPPGTRIEIVGFDDPPSAPAAPFGPPVETPPAFWHNR